MKEVIKVIAFDADDTLWSNEPFFRKLKSNIPTCYSLMVLPKIFQPPYFKPK